MIPRTNIQKSDGNTGVVRPSATGILAIISTAEKGPLNVAAGYARPDLVAQTYGGGKLTSAAEYVMKRAQKPVVLIRAAGTTAADYGAVSLEGEGTSVITEGASVPLDDFDVVVLFPKGGTVGTAGITYKYSLDGGESYSAELALGTANTITLPGTGVSLALAAGTILAGETAAVAVTGPRATNADLVAALEALRVTNIGWEAVLVDEAADATMLSTLDAWLTTLEGTGKFRLGIMGARMKSAAELAAGGTGEATYRTAMQTAWSASSTIRVLVAGDGGDLPLTVGGTTAAAHPRSAALGIAARLMAIDPSEDAAYVSRGPIPDYRIADVRGNPRWHDEALYPGLDDLRLATFRSIDGREGVYVNNPLLLSPSGSDYVYAQHARVMNLACERAKQLLDQRLSQGVRKSKKADPTTGAVYILEEDAAEVELFVDEGVKAVTENRVSDAAFHLSRTDDLGSNAGVIVTGDVEIESKAYIKGFEITSRFVRKITASAA